VIFAKGKLLPDTALPEVLSGLEEEINATRATLTLEPETVIAAIEALGARLDRGELDALLAQFATPKMLSALEDIRPQLTREALEHKLQTELGRNDRLKKAPPLRGSCRRSRLRGVSPHITHTRRPLCAASNCPSPENCPASKWIRF
jgi:hypothetical protein